MPKHPTHHGTREGSTPTTTILQILSFMPGPSSSHACPCLKPSNSHLPASQCPTSTWGYTRRGQQVALRLPFPLRWTGLQTPAGPCPSLLSSPAGTGVGSVTSNCPLSFLLAPATRPEETPVASAGSGLSFPARWVRRVPKGPSCSWWGGAGRG